MSDGPYLLDYLRESGRLGPESFDALRYEYDRRIYGYGEHFRQPFRKPGAIASLRDEFLWRLRIIKRSRNALSRADIQSNAYSTINEKVRALGYTVAPPPWQGSLVGRDRTVLGSMRRLQQFFSSADYNDLLSEDFFALLAETESTLREYYRLFRALIVPYDIVFFENMSIRLFREAGKPSFVFLHGLPGRYNAIDDQRADYLAVWGDAIRENYIRAGGDPDRIFVAGRPGTPAEPSRERRSSLDNVLVITKSAPGGQPITGRTILADRGNLIVYLYEVEDVLKRLGVRKARFRPHPSERGAWYLKYIDRGFYALDTESLDESLRSATTVIGPTSTVFLDALCRGVEYRVFEPATGDIDLLNYPLVPPFDGSDSRVPVAKDAATLEQIIKDGERVGDTLLRDYGAVPFNASFIRNIVG